MTQFGAQFRSDSPARARIEANGFAFQRRCLETAAEAQERAMQERKAQLQEREAALERRALALAEQTQTLSDRSKTVTWRAKALDRREQTLARKEQDINERAALLQALGVEVGPRLRQPSAAEKIEAEVCKRRRVKLSELKIDRRINRLVVARHEMWWSLASVLAPVEIGERYGFAKASVLYGIRKHQQRIDAGEV